MRKKITRPEEEDATSLGGWLFADSFLALMVIFLATISFVPALGGAVSNDSNIGNIAGGNYSKGLNLVYEEFNEGQLQADIGKFASEEGLPVNADVLYVKIVGGYDPRTERSDDGTFRALLFSAKIKGSALTRFDKAKFDLGASDKLKSSQIVLRVTLSGS